MIKNIKHEWIKCPKCRKKNFKLEEVEGVLNFTCNHCNMVLQWKDKGKKEVLEYLSKRGFRESNYEIIELTKWLMEVK